MAICESEGEGNVVSWSSLRSDNWEISEVTVDDIELSALCMEDKLIVSEK